MFVVVVDTATPAVTAALVEVSVVTEDSTGGVEVRAERVVVDARAHGERLAPGIDHVLRGGGLRPADLAAVVAGVGPGPFTGLRVGLVTAAALGDSLGIPTYGVCSLDGLGMPADGSRPTPAHETRPVPTADARLVATDETRLVATDARRREVYWAVYRQGVRLTEPAVNPPADLTEAILAHRVDHAVGEGALRYADQLAVPVRDQPRYPSARVLAGYAAPRIRAGAPTERLIPLYLRRPDAVEWAGR